VYPNVWQWTSSPLDTNAFRGNTDQLRNLFQNGVRDVTQPAQSYNEIHNLSLATFWGGSSCGALVPTTPESPWQGKPSNAILAKLDYIIRSLDALPAGQLVPHTHLVVEPGTTSTVPSGPAVAT
jgi:hypothetical protein